nr:recombinase family protein [Cloacibacillus evryensis]
MFPRPRQAHRRASFCAKYTMHSYNTITDYIITDFILQSRPAYRKLMKKLRPDDTPAIKGIDRLGRNYDEILEQWRFITKNGDRHG